MRTNKSLWWIGINGKYSHSLSLPFYPFMCTLCSRICSLFLPPFVCDEWLVGHNQHIIFQDSFHLSCRKIHTKQFHFEWKPTKQFQSIEEDFYLCLSLRKTEEKETPRERTSAFWLKIQFEAFFFVYRKIIINWNKLKTQLEFIQLVNEIQKD